MERTLWVVGLLAVFVLLVWLMYRGWQGRARRQTERIGALPAVPAEPGAQVLQPTTGLYLGSTMAPSWQDRITVGDLGFRATAVLSRFEKGILLERDGAATIWIPRESVSVLRTERGHAGKVMTEGGVLVIRWKLPTGTEIDIGFRGDDKTVYPAWTADSTGPADTAGQTGDDEG